MNNKNELLIGHWIVLDVFGDYGLLKEDYYDDDSKVECFKTKREALDKISYWECDSNKKPKVERIRKGEYWYHPKDEDGEYVRVYSIEKVTQENIKKLTDIANYTGEYERFMED